MKAIVLFIVVLFCSFSAKAATLVGFGGVPNLGAAATIYNENGVKAETNNGDLAHHSVVGKIHLVDFGTSFASSISFSMGGDLFDALQFDLGGVNRHCFDFSCSGPEAFNNVEVIGVRNNLEVATSTFYSGIDDNTHVFGASFSDLDSLTIRLLLPGDFNNSTCGAFNFDFCSSIDLDNLELRAVDLVQTPLPAGLPLYGAGMVLLGYVVRRRRRKQQS